MMLSLNIATDYSVATGLRHCRFSDNSGEDFYHKQLNAAFIDALSKKEKLHVILDGNPGYAPSFIDESFGNLVYDFSLDIVKQWLEVISFEEPEWIQLLNDRTYKEWEQKRLNKVPVVVTAVHPAWGRLINGKVEYKVWETPAA